MQDIATPRMASCWRMVDSRGGVPRKLSPVQDFKPSMRLSTASESHTTILLMMQILTPNKLSTKSSRWHPLLRPPTTGSTVLWLEPFLLSLCTEFLGRMLWRRLLREQEQRWTLAPDSLAGLVLEEEDCRTLRGADMLLYDNGSDERRVIILATSDNLTITEESTSWYLDGTFKSAPQLFYQLLVLHAELTDTPGKSWILPTVYILLTKKTPPSTLLS